MPIFHIKELPYITKLNILCNGLIPAAAVHGFIYLGVPVFDSSFRNTSIPLCNLGFPRMLPFAIQLVPAHHRSLNGRCLERDGIAFCLEISGGESKLNSVQPKITASSIGLRRSETYGDGLTVILRSGNEYAVIINDSPL